ncbi:MAG: glycosyltransferase family 4 protein [Nitrososphaeria archaeon]
MKVLIISHSGIGGAEIYAESLYQTLKKLGIMTLHITNTSQLMDIYKSNTLSKGWIVDIHLTRPLNLIKTILLSSNKYTRILSIHGLMRAHLLNEFLMVRIHDVNMFLSPEGLLKTIGWHVCIPPVLSFILRECDCVINVTQRDMHLIRVLGFKKPIFTVWGGARDIFFSMSRLRMAQNRYNLLYVGKFEPTKGIWQLLRALSLLRFPKIRLIVVSRGAFIYERLFYKFVKKLGLQHKVFAFKGLSLKDLALLYRTSDLFIFPSFCEGMPLSVIEALANGLPVITTPAGDLENLIKLSKAGVVITSSKSFADPKLIASAVEAVLNEPYLLKYYSENAMSYAKRYLTWDFVTKRRLAIYKVMEILKN